MSMLVHVQAVILPNTMHNLHLTDQNSEVRISHLLPLSSAQVISPDGTPVLSMRTSPMGDCLAVATAKGLYAIDLMDNR